MVETLFWKNGAAYAYTGTASSERSPPSSVDCGYVGVVLLLLCCCYAAWRGVAWSERKTNSTDCYIKLCLFNINTWMPGMLVCMYSSICAAFCLEAVFVFGFVQHDKHEKSN